MGGWVGGWEEGCGLIEGGVASRSDSLRSHEARRVWLHHVLKPLPDWAQQHIADFLPAVPVPRVRNF